MFSGVREDPFFQTGQRNIPELRKRCPLPSIFIHPTAAEGLESGDWVELQTAYGKVTAELSVQDSMKEGTCECPTAGGIQSFEARRNSVARSFRDAVLCSDDDEFLDHEQGIPHFKGYPGRLVKVEKPLELEAS